MAARFRLADTVTDQEGRPLSGVSISVCNEGTSTPIAVTMYAADTGSTTVANPLVTDAFGYVAAYFIPADANTLLGRVTLIPSRAGYTFSTGIVAELDTPATLSLTPAFEVDAQALSKLSLINYRVTSADTNAKALWRLMPKGEGENVTTGDRAEFTLMGVDVDDANRWWADIKVRQKIDTGVRFLHFLTDCEGTAEPITHATFEIDGANESTGETEEFSICRNGWVDHVRSGAGAGEFMFHIVANEGITAIESNQIYLDAGNFIIGAAAGSLVTRSSVRPFTDDDFTLGQAIFRYTNLFLSGYQEFSVMTAPAAPASDRVFLYVDTSGGKDRLMACFASGAAQQVAIEP